MAQLSLQGITGVMYIDLRQLSPLDSGRRLLANVPSERYPVIPSVHSDLDLFLGSLPDLASRLNDLVDRGASVLSQQNIDALQRHGWPIWTRPRPDCRRAPAISSTCSNRRATTVDEMRQVGGQSARCVRRRRAWISSPRCRSCGPPATISRAPARVSTPSWTHNGNQVSGLVRDAVPQLESLLRDSRTAITQINELARSAA